MLPRSWPARILTPELGESAVAITAAKAMVIKKAMADEEGKKISDRDRLKAFIGMNKNERFLASQNPVRTGFDAVCTFFESD